jgi:hypothetical protein
MLTTCSPTRITATLKINGWQPSRGQEGHLLIGGRRKMRLIYTPTKNGEQRTTDKIIPSDLTGMRQHKEMDVGMFGEVVVGRRRVVRRVQRGDEWSKKEVGGREGIEEGREGEWPKMK